MIKQLTIGLVTSLITALPSVAAEQVIIAFGPWRGAIRVESLESFATDGKINSNLEFFLRRVSPEAREKFREALVKRVEVDPVLLSRFFRSGIGEDILSRMGNGITIDGGINGKFALRAALVQAALDREEGLTLLNVLRKFPNDVQLQGEGILRLSNTIDRVVRATNFFTAEIARLSTEEAKNESFDFSKLPDIRQRGPYGVAKEDLTFKDPKRERTLSARLYLPNGFRQGKTPVIIVSHGLGSRPEDFADMAEHLASYGYVVALPVHSGSDTARKRDFIAGLTRDIFATEEFIDRPLDISATIDELARANRGRFGGRLDTDNVGVWGHSFGGYTALAVAGANIDFNYLKSVCERPYTGINMSVLLQCQALKLERREYNFKDDRVKAILIQNPLNSAIFGPEQLAKIKIPVMITGGDYDPATPFVLEQVRAFTWLTGENKYLGLKEGQAHVDLSQLDAGITEILDVLPDLQLAGSDVLSVYRDGMNVGFFEVFIAGNQNFRPFLTPAYAAFLSRDQRFRLFLVDASARATLAEAVKKF